MVVHMLIAIQVAAAPAPVPPHAPPAAAPASDRPLAALAMTPLAPKVTGIARPTPAQVRAAVDAEWQRYDTARTGRLSPLQFGTWVLAANGARGKVKPVTTMNATARAFARADANHDGAVTAEEMVAFLGR